MHVLIVHCHPEPVSFNTALTQTGVDVFRSRGDTVEVSELYGQDFDPVEKAGHYSDRDNVEQFSALSEQRHAYKNGTLAEDVKREISRLEKADLVVLQFPIWWHSIPAMLKGWMDRIFISGGLYSSKMRYDRGYFRGKKVVCSATTGAPAVSFEPGGRGGEIQQILWSTHYSLYYMGFDVLVPQIAYGVQGHGYRYTSDELFARQMKQIQSDWETRLMSIEGEDPLSFPGWDDWDEMGRLKPVNSS
ncbi:MAG: NAD(P)H-dependent oxidoreductase [Granulosicoccaceae bacterium]